LVHTTFEGFLGEEPLVFLPREVNPRVVGLLVGAKGGKMCVSDAQAFHLDQYISVVR